MSGKTREEVRKKLTKAMADRDRRGLVFDAGALTVGQHLEGWLKDSVRDTMRESTYETDEYVTYPNIVPASGRAKLKDLKPAHVRGFYRERLDAGYSSATVRKMHIVLHGALDRAVPDGLVARNVAKRVKLPQGGKKAIQPLSPEQALLDTAQGDGLEALYVLAVNTGLRQGEPLALRWEDVDLEKSVLHVGQTLTRKGGKVPFGNPKTKGSCRSVGLTQDAVEALRATCPGSLTRWSGWAPSTTPGGSYSPTRSAASSTPPTASKPYSSAPDCHRYAFTA